MSTAKKTTPRDYTMKYAGKNPMEKLHPGEPYFFIRAQDRLSLDALQHYASLLKMQSDLVRNCGQDEKADELLKQSLGVLNVANFFIDWQEDHRDLVKLPD
jgi:hypothetical protein